jgi:hypothetical protein
MKIQNLKTKVIGPVLLLIPMACMHLGDGHHGDGHHSGYGSCYYSSESSQPSPQSTTSNKESGRYDGKG